MEMNVLSSWHGTSFTNLESHQTWLFKALSELTLSLHLPIPFLEFAGRLKVPAFKSFGLISDQSQPQAI